MGLKKGKNEASLPGNNVLLTNCFAATYAFMQSIESQLVTLGDLSPEEGSFKGFDALIRDPIRSTADLTVGYEMCEYGKILE